MSIATPARRPTRSPAPAPGALATVLSRQRPADHRPDSAVTSGAPNRLKSTVAKGRAVHSCGVRGCCRSGGSISPIVRQPGQVGDRPLHGVPALRTVPRGKSSAPVDARTMRYVAVSRLFSGGVRVSGTSFRGRVGGCCHLPRSTCSLGVRTCIGRRECSAQSNVGVDQPVDHHWPLLDVRDRSEF